MRKVLTLACLLAVAHHIAAQSCSTLPTYSETLVPECAKNDVYVNWPNYENQATYYKCNGVGNPVLANCPSNQYFCFVLQQCVDCNQLIPAVPCKQLKTQNTPNCVPIEGGSTGSPGGPTLPTPLYPSTTTTEKTTKTTTEKTTKSTTETVTEPITPTQAPGPTPPTENPGSSTSDIPPPPSPVTNDPNIPMPPTPGPTPPSVVVTPPNVAPSAPIAG